MNNSKLTAGYKSELRRTAYTAGWTSSCSPVSRAVGEAPWSQQSATKVGGNVNDLPVTTAPDRRIIASQFVRRPTSIQIKHKQSETEIHRPTPLLQSEQPRTSVGILSALSFNFWQQTKCLWADYSCVIHAGYKKQNKNLQTASTFITADLQATFIFQCLWRIFL
jgi:hypothetical protein